MNLRLWSVVMVVSMCIVFLTPSVSMDASAFGGGDGSGGNPYIITDVTELQSMNTDPSANYILGNDIDASATSGWNGGDGFEQVGDLGTKFTGSFNGDGYTISYLFIDRPTTNYVGLFGVIDGASISYAKLNNIDVTGGEYTGGLVGYTSSSSSVSDCSTSGSVSGNGFIGGLFGSIKGSVSNSYSTCSVSGTSFVGGLAGGTSYTTVSDCYATGDVSCVGNHAGGLIGATNTDSISNSYSAGSVSGSSSVGGLIGTKDVGSSVSDSYYDSTTSGQSDTGKGIPKTTAEMKTESTFVGWDFVSTWSIIESVTYPLFYGSSTIAIISSPSDGSHFPSVTSAVFVWSNGSAFGETYRWDWGDGDVTYGISSSHMYSSADVYTITLTVLNSTLVYTDTDTISVTMGYPTFVITDVWELQAMGTKLTVNYTLGNDIDATDTWEWWLGFRPIGNDITPFTGSFDGNNYTISNLFIDRPTTTDVGLFGYVDGASFSNVVLENVDISGGNFTGGLVGMINSSSVDECFASGSVIGSTNVGGLGGLLTGSTSISNSYATNSVSGSSSVGGLVGGAYYGTINNCFYDTNTSGQSDDDGRGVPKTTEEMQTVSTFINAGWDIFDIYGHNNETWYIDEGMDYLRLGWAEHDNASHVRQFIKVLYAMLPIIVILMFFMAIAGLVGFRSRY